VRQCAAVMMHIHDAASVLRIPLTCTDLLNAKWIFNNNQYYGHANREIPIAAKPTEVGTICSTRNKCSRIINILFVPTMIRLDQIEYTR
jgi:hypothetical protein